ncbi:hypothetical protein D3C81_1470410 [compost metagenome]
MIRFNIGYNRQPGVVLKEGAVAFIRFGHDEFPLSGFGIGADIHNFPADNISRVYSAVLHDQSDHRGGGCFAVRPCNGNSLAFIQQPGQHL